MVSDNGILAEVSGPEEVRLAENATKQATGDAEEDEDDVVGCLVGGAVIGFEENELAGAGGVQRFEDHGREERAEKGSPKDFAREVCRDFLVTDQ